jgi:hypothetical protein
MCGLQALRPLIQSLLRSIRSVTAVACHYGTSLVHCAVLVREWKLAMQGVKQASSNPAALQFDRN